MYIHCHSGKDYQTRNVGNMTHHEMAIVSRYTYLISDRTMKLVSKLEPWNQC